MMKQRGSAPSPKYKEYALWQLLRTRNGVVQEAYLGYGSRKMSRQRFGAEMWKGSRQRNSGLECVLHPGKQWEVSRHGFLGLYSEVLQIPDQRPNLLGTGKPLIISKETVPGSKLCSRKINLTTITFWDPVMFFDTRDSSAEWVSGYHSELVKRSHFSNVLFGVGFPFKNVF